MLIEESEESLSRPFLPAMSLIAPILIATAGRYPLVLSCVFWRPHVPYRRKSFDRRSTDISRKIASFCGNIK